MASMCKGAYPSQPLALVIRGLCLVVMLSVCQLAGEAAEPAYDPDVILVIKEKAFHVVKGTVSVDDSPQPGFSLSPGEEITLELRNEDKLPHEFVSPLFNLVEFQFWGKATLVYTYMATGMRIEPGDMVALRFELPKGSFGKQFKFWCNVHGKLHGDTLQGEILVVTPKPGTS